MTRKDYILIAAALEAAGDYAKQFPHQSADTFAFESRRHGVPRE